jgi:hypothetical protein
MKYFETELVFTREEPRPKGSYSCNGSTPGADDAEVLGIMLLLGNRPLVYNLKDLCRRGGKQPPSSKQDHYLIVHTISAQRTHGTARVEELQYFAAAIQPAGLQTVDLMPKTRFNEIIRTDLNLSGYLDLFGEVSLDVPSVINDGLINEFVDLGSGIKLQLSASARFIGRFIYTPRVPIVQASGVGSGCCSWILRPDENRTPLLGDQRLIQSITVPRGTKKLTYKISGLVRADKGLFWKQQEKRTPEYNVIVNLIN